MVGPTYEEWLEERRAGLTNAPESEELSDMDKDIIGGTCRLEIPFRDVYRMRQTAELLRGYADKLDFYSRRTDLPIRTILLTLKLEARALNKAIRETRSAGRPRRREEE